VNANAYRWASLSSRHTSCAMVIRIFYPECVLRPDGYFHMVSENVIIFNRRTTSVWKFLHHTAMLKRVLYGFSY
jgi:hypothetical protein